MLLKDIAHNFLEANEETLCIIEKLFNEEDEFIANMGKADMVFGIYRKI